MEATVEGGISDARNRLVFNMFSLADVGERSGMGLCNIFNVWRRNGFPRPDIGETADPARVSLTLSLEPEEKAGGRDSSGEREGGAAGGNSPAACLSERERSVLREIASDPSVSAVRISARTGIPRTSVEKALRSLKGKRVISRIGSTRGSWKVLQS